MPKTYEGKWTGGQARFAIAASRFNSLFTKELVDGALDTLRRHGISEESVEIAWVPGAMELPLVCRRLAESERFDAVIALGAVVRGGTPHFEHVAQVAVRGVSQVSLSANVPVIAGILTTDTLEQAMERSGTKAGNKGSEAAKAALEMTDLLRQLSGS